MEINLVEQIRKNRKIEAEELTAHDVVALVVLSGLCANPATDSEALRDKLVKFSRGVADEFMKQREEAK
ncbi:MAG: hypothetical protein M0Q93_00040 [Terrimicrobiaceae bacterium]|jgi:hypothetical protein|nr:hypothetical protein [Terrimicrobiaceae bacterium]